MKTNEVKVLLQKYYNGLTSPGEESDLEEYFLNGRVDPEFEADKIHFLAVAAMRDEEIPVPDDLEASVLDALKVVQKDHKHANRRITYMVLSVAAGLFLMVSTYILLSRQNQTQYISDPKIAYAESREALEMVSKFFNEGTSQLSGLSRINQAFEPLQKLNSLDKAAKRLSAIGKLQNQK
ncbi:MAG: hypothetical protein NTV01_07510 [Bacteroidia bacterium]|nr:hypothetical protein [Bacteroidia bacterium]